MKVLILGANSDVAEALVIMLANNGHELLLAGRSKEKLLALQSDLQIRIKATCDIVDFDALAIDGHQEWYNGLKEQPDWVVVAFGVLTEQDDVVKNPKIAVDSYLVNMLGAISILDIISNDFEARKAGVIVGISSVAGERGRGSNYTYGSAKAGFTAYLSGLRNRLYKSDVHVVTVNPGLYQDENDYTS